MRTSDRQLLDRLKELIKEINGTVIHENSVLFKDLDLIGDDASCFLQKFSKEFDVDMSDFEFEKYFIEEYSIPFQYWFDRLFKEERLRRKEFGIQHLIEVAKKKKWIDI